MAERLGLDRSYLADVERGKRNISIVNVEIIAKGFRLSLSQLFSRLRRAGCLQRPRFCLKEVFERKEETSRFAPKKTYVRFAGTSVLKPF